jgi:hypothetical protein
VLLLLLSLRCARACVRSLAPVTQSQLEDLGCTLRCAAAVLESRASLRTQSVGVCCILLVPRAVC